MALIPWAACEARAAEQTYDEWFAQLDATHRIYAESMARSIAKNVPAAKRVDPQAHTYGDPAARSAIIGRVRQAIAAGDDKAAVDAWVELFAINNANWAHVAGYEASPEVLREVAHFWLPINRVNRDEHTAGSADYRLLDAAMQATQRMIDRK